MADRTPEEIAAGLNDTERRIVLAETQIFVERRYFESLVAKGVMGKLDGELAAILLTEYALTDLGRAVAAILRGEKADG